MPPRQASAFHAHPELRGGWTRPAEGPDLSESDTIAGVSAALW
jgi:hypothetical protein